MLAKSFSGPLPLCQSSSGKQEGLVCSHTNLIIIQMRLSADVGKFIVANQSFTNVVVVVSFISKQTNKPL